MKKTYINPAVKVITIARPNLCVISNNSADIYTTNVGASEALGRDSEGDWDEE